MAEAGVNRDFIGLNKSKPETNLQPNEAFHAKNVIFSRERIEKRRGSLKLTPFTIPKSSLGFDGGENAYAETVDITQALHDSLGLTMGDAFTVEFSLKFNSGNDTSTQCIAQRGFQQSQGAFGWALGFEEDTRVFRFRQAVDSGTDIDVAGTYTNYSPNKPVTISVAREAGTNIVTMYANDGDFSGSIGSQSLVGTVETQTTYPITFASGDAHTLDGSQVWHLNGRLQEFRLWDHERAESGEIDTYALKELPPHVASTDSLRLYYKFNEGDGIDAFDYGFITTLTTATNYYAAKRLPSPPEWVPGLVTGGLADKAIRLDGKDDAIGFLNRDDVLKTLRTGTTDWTVEFVLSPLDQPLDGGVFLMYGNDAFLVGESGHAFKVYEDATDLQDRKFQFTFCMETATASITWTTGFTSSLTYGITVQRTRDEFRVKVDDISSDILGTFVTTTADSPGNPGFKESVFMIAGASFPSTNTVFPNSDFVNAIIDEVRVWNGVREEDKTISYAMVTDNDLIGYWKMNEGSGDLAFDSSVSDNAAVVFPTESIGSQARWEAGFVEPVNGPEIEGLFYYQVNKDLTSPNDARDRSIVAVAGNTIYRNEGNKWNEIVTGRKQGLLSQADQLDNKLAIVNGLDENLVYDGTRIFVLGFENPTDPPSASVLTITGFTWDFTTGFGAGIALGSNSLTCRDVARTEPTNSFVGQRVIHYDAGVQLETRVEEYHLRTTYTCNIGQSIRDTTSLLFSIVNVSAAFPLGPGGQTIPTSVAFPPQYGLEGAEIACGFHDGSTQTRTIVEDLVFTRSTFSIRPIGTKAIQRKIMLDSPFSIVGGTNTVPNYTNAQVILSNHFVWQARATSTIYSTTTYEISLLDAGVTGPFFYRYTNYNRFLDQESNPSPPVDSVVEPNSQAVVVTVGTVTDTNVTDRLIYRSKFGGGGVNGKGFDYFFIGTLTGTAFGTFVDSTPSGLEGNLISFLKDKPEVSYLIKAFKGRMWYVYSSVPNRVYFSQPERPGEVDPFNFLIFGDATDHITGIGISGDNLVVFKRRSTWLVTRSDVPAGMRPYRISDSVGCVSHNSIQEINGEIYFLSEDGVYTLQGSVLRKISDPKVNYYIDRLDTDRLHRAVAQDVRSQGIYRLNLTPASAHATTVATGRNSWYLDYHYDRSGKHAPFFEPIWSYGEREVSYYGRFIGENNFQYDVFGDYRGNIFLDNIAGAYNEGLGWFRTAAAAGRASKLTSQNPPAGAYTATVDATLFSDGHGLKGLTAKFVSSTTSESHVIYANSGSDAFIMQSALSISYASGDSVFIGPIESEYESGWMDLGSNMRDKKLNKMMLDYALTTNSSTMTVIIQTDRADDGTANIYDTQTFPMDTISKEKEFRTQGRHMKLRFVHDWPGENFELFNWNMDVNPKGLK